MQVDWGECGRVQAGNTSRKVSVLVAVLCYNRMTYIEFTLSQRKAEFYRCLVHALEFFGASPRAIIFDNLKTAVINGSGRAACFHPEFLALCGHYYLQPIACERRDPESNGKQEAFWGTLEGRLMRMLDSTAQLTLELLNQATQAWVEIEYNRSVHRETSSSPVDRLRKRFTCSARAQRASRFVMRFAWKPPDASGGAMARFRSRACVSRFRHGIATSVKSPCAMRAGTWAASTWSTRAAERFWLPFFLSTKAPTLTAAAHSSSSNPRTRFLRDPLRGRNQRAPISIESWATSSRSS